MGKGTAGLKVARTPPNSRHEGKTLAPWGGGDQILLVDKNELTRAIHPVVGMKPIEINA